MGDKKSLACYTDKTENPPDDAYPSAAVVTDMLFGLDDQFFDELDVFQCLLSYVSVHFILVFFL
jgi:hypothetical protein